MFKEVKIGKDIEDISLTLVRALKELEKSQSFFFEASFNATEKRSIYLAKYYLNQAHQLTPHINRLSYYLRKLKIVV
jgi:hypothetical protein